jgi:hypothetical protein
MHNIEINGRGITMEDGAVNQLMSAVGLSKPTTASLLSSIGQEGTVHLANLLKTSRSFKPVVIGKGKARQEAPKSVAVIIDKHLGSVVGFSNSMKQIMPNSIFIETLEKLMNNNPTMELVHADTTSSGIRVNMRNPNWGFKIGKHKEEEFWAGLSYISEPDGVFLDQYFERLICSNGMTFKNNVSSLECTQEQLVGPFIQAINRTKATTTMSFEMRVEKYMQVYASVAEIGRTFRFVKEVMKDKQYALPTIKSLIPVDDIKKTFSKETGIHNVFVAPEEIQSKLLSPVKYWDLVNDVTYFASHYNNISSGGRISPANRNLLMAYAGNMINDTPDFYMPIKQAYKITK